MNPKQSLLAYLRGKGIDTDNDHYLKHLIHTLIEVKTRDLKIIIKAHERTNKRIKKELTFGEKLIERYNDTTQGTPTSLQPNQEPRSKNQGTGEGTDNKN